MAEEPFVFRIRAQDRAGVLSAITTAFSSRGVSLDSVVAVAAPNGADSADQHIVLSFRATPAKRRELQRTLERRNGVCAVEGEPLSSPRVVAIAFNPAVICGTPEMVEQQAPHSGMIITLLPREIGDPA